MKKILIITTKKTLKFNLKNKRYIFYPATFWPHKNHQYLIDVAKIFKRDKKRISYLFYVDLIKEH